MEKGMRAASATPATAANPRKSQKGTGSPLGFACSPKQRAEAGFPGWEKKKIIKEKHEQKEEEEERAKRDEQGKHEGIQAEP